MHYAPPLGLDLPRLEANNWFDIRDPKRTILNLRKKKRAFVFRADALSISRLSSQKNCRVAIMLARQPRSLFRVFRPCLRVPYFPRVSHCLTRTFCALSKEPLTPPPTPTATATTATTTLPSEEGKEGLSIFLFVLWKLSKSHI